MTTLKAASSSEDTVTFGAKMATPGSEALPTATDEGGRFAAAATSTIIGAPAANAVGGGSGDGFTGVAADTANRRGECGCGGGG
eukprot:CAMPEP_0173104326 /NCGR_PEP_ID=MMETSP1102-20130122/39141_1 /TAXON_ID=49646 /ORGANISM="Geminigera sp., Strain Caron Lab Isolate" /LENGTH=83 /DNA_ID=CAMNT_0013999755 /DNA_START=93 /DNA_END=341 /DNA_ORIENTATION=+